MLVTSIFSIFPKCLKKASSSTDIKSWDCVVKSLLFSTKQKCIFVQIKSICRQHIMQFFSRRVGSIVGIEKNTGYQHFLLFRKCFPKTSSWGGGGIKRWHFEVKHLPNNKMLDWDWTKLKALSGNK